ncbi:hypothetical protein Tco_1371524 [Tanacetum coccineum]
MIKNFEFSELAFERQSVVVVIPDHSVGVTATQCKSSTPSPQSSDSHMLHLRLIGMAPRNSTILLDTKVGIGYSGCLWFRVDASLKCAYSVDRVDWISLQSFAVLIPWKELSKESGSKILQCGDGSAEGFKPIV